LSAPIPLRLRPLEIGDLLDETFRMYRRHFFIFAGISVILTIPLAALTGFGFASLSDELMRFVNSGQAPDFNQLTPSLLLLGAALLVGFALYPFTAGAVIYAACESALGRPVTLWGVLGGILRRYFPIAGYLILVWLMAVMFCLLPLWIWIWVGWIAVLPVMLIENTGLVAAMGRSWSLLEGRWWRTFLILLLIGILWYVVRLALGAVLFTVNLLLQTVLSPVMTLAIVAAASEVLYALATPVVQIALVLIYFDLRVRREGLDLFQLAQQMAAPQPAS
jgi:hypothetical protein